MNLPGMITLECGVSPFTTVTRTELGRSLLKSQTLPGDHIVQAYQEFVHTAFVDWIQLRAARNLSSVLCPIFDQEMRSPTILRKYFPCFGLESDSEAEDPQPAAAGGGEKRSQSAKVGEPLEILYDPGAPDIE